MNKILQFKKKRKYIKKKTYVIVTIPKFRPIIGYGMSGLKDAKQQATSIYKEFLNIYKRPETMFHFIKVPFKKKGDWNYDNVCKYVEKSMTKINKKNFKTINDNVKNWNMNIHTFNSK